MAEHKDGDSSLLNADQPSAPDDLRLTTVKQGGATLRIISVSCEADSSKDRLTQAEAAVAEALLSGQSQREIAHQRGTSVRTVANQVQSIYRKYGVRSREELALALLAGLPQPNMDETPE